MEQDSVVRAALLPLCNYIRFAAVAGPVLVMRAPFTPSGKKPPLVALALPPKAR